MCHFYYKNAFLSRMKIIGLKVERCETHVGEDLFRFVEGHFSPVETGVGIQRFLVRMS